MTRVNIVDLSLKNKRVSILEIYGENYTRREMNSLFGKFAFDNDKRCLHFQIVSETSTTNFSLMNDFNWKRERVELMKTNETFLIVNSLVLTLSVRFYCTRGKIVLKRRGIATEASLLKLIFCLIFINALDCISRRRDNRETLESKTK